MLICVMGRVPVLDVVARRLHIWSHWAYTCSIRCTRRTFALCCYVDNLYPAAHDRAAACAIIDDCESHLSAAWGLAMGDDSRSTMAARGAVDDPPDLGRWPSVVSMSVLGRVVSDSSSSRPCRDRTFSLMWQAYYANVAKLRGGGVKQCHSKLLNRSVCPVLTYRCVGWAFTPGTAKAIRTLQNVMNARSLTLIPVPGESRGDYWK